MATKHSFGFHITVATAIILGAAARTEGASTMAVPAETFLDSIGTQSAISRRGEDFQKTLKCVQYLGVRWMRSGIEGDVPIEQLIELHKETGLRFSWGLGSGGADLPKLIETAKRLASVGALLAFEGPNEPNNWGVTYQGHFGGRDKSWAAVAEMQRDLYNAVKNDPILRNYPVWSPSEVGAETDNVGLQFLTIPPGAQTLLPAGTRYADFVNVHNYIYHPNAPGLEENKTWKAADPTRACKVDGLFGEFGVTWARHFQGYSDTALLTLPRVTTETGTTIGGAVTEEIHALNLLTLYLDQFKRGWAYTANYLMRDRVDEAGNQRFGFFAPDYSPRKAAVYLHNLTTILEDRDSFKPGKSDYSIGSPPATVHDLLLQKSNGAFELVVWDERIDGTLDKVEATLGRSFATVNVYDPTRGTPAIQTLTDVSSVSVTLSDHPVIIEMTTSSR
ncbi:MAG TPA: glycosyl hydrolase [Verrucomicrobiae bacterium]|jgi:hypothetical protein